MHRIMLEALVHNTSSFVTLTYDERAIPKTTTGKDTLRPEDLQKFLKRLRKRLAPLRLRFFACGEYGETTWRPHYHVALFGFGPCARGRTRRLPGKSEPRWQECCDTCSIIGEAWGSGIVEVGELCGQSASYIAGYVVKKMTAKDDARLDGRYPEFARMSNRPGLGYGAIPEVAATLRHFGVENRGGDVPAALRHGSKIYPLGRYLTGRLRVEVGYGPEAPAETLQRLDEGLRLVREDAFSRSISLKQAIKEANEGKREALLGRYKIFNSRRVI